jgi:hypothetical protein
MPKRPGPLAQVPWGKDFKKRKAKVRARGRTKPHERCWLVIMMMELPSCYS